MSGVKNLAGGAQQVSSRRLLTTLAVAGAVAGFLIVSAYESATPAIEANRAATIDLAIREVLEGVARYEPLYADGESLTTTPPRSGEGHVAPAVYAGVDSGGRLVGYAITTREPGFQEQIEILFGVDPRAQSVIGLAILSSRETPGLGDKIQGEGWRAQFKGRTAPVVGIKNGGAATPSTVDMITGATISSRAVIGAINHAMDRWAPLLAKHSQEVRP